MQTYLFLLLFTLIYTQQQHGWNYFSGGNDWQKIWPTCSSAKGQQSPIDIRYENMRNVTQAILNFEAMAKNSVVQVENNGYFLKADFPWMGIKVNDHTGKVRKAQCFTMSFHAPSEHIIEGNRFNMEIQFTCEDVIENGKFLNLAILCESERFQENKFIDKFATAAVNLKSKGAKQKVSLNFEESFFETLQNNNIEEYYAYSGSFTSPPCHHSVSWIIFSKPIKISDQSLSQFQNLWAGNQDFAGGSGNYRNLQILHKQTKIILGRFEQSLAPLDISDQLNGFEKEDTESEEYYKNKIDRNLQILVKQRSAEEYKLKAVKKLKYLKKSLEIYKTQFHEYSLNGDGTNTELLAQKINSAKIELEQFQANCMEYKEDSDCNPEINEAKQEPQEDQSEEQKKQEAIQQSQELSDTKTLKTEEVMVTHDGQEVTMKVPDDLQFVQTSKKRLRKRKLQFTK